jgi:hypothetical protein
MCVIFFVKDKVDNGELKLVNCKTDQMRADFFTKPLQGCLVQKPYYEYQRTRPHVGYS